MVLTSDIRNDTSKTASEKYESTREGFRNGQNKYGLTTRVALERLHEEILQVLQEYELKYAKESCYRKITSAFIKRYESPLGWFAIATSILSIIALLIIKSYLSAAFLSAILLLVVFIVMRENHLRRTEIYRKTRSILREIRMAADLCDEWETCNYPHLCSPISPCVSLQWTYRDGVVLNMPWALLVKGDHIVLRPGQITPGPCTEVNGKKSFNAHEIYGVSQVNDPPIRPAARTPLPDLVCSLENTPYLDNLKIILDNSLKRPPTIYNQQRYLLVSKYIQQWGFICATSLTVFIGLMRMYGVGVPSSSNDEFSYSDLLIEAPIAAVLPLLPLIFPLMWISMNLWGIARLQAFLKTPQLFLTKDSEKSFEEDLDTPSYDYDNVSILRSNVFRIWLHLWKGDSELLPRSANVVQVLGSITALCCVDKKGILSWPNPTAEKVFFLHDTANDDMDERSSYDSSVYTDSEEPIDQENKQGGIVAEVLDLTHDQHCPFRLEFDDHDWKLHIKSLKPLGLAILLNTCSPLTHTHYTQFCGHVTAVAMLDKDLVPVTNRYAIVESSMNSFLHGRCLCELAKQIGFTDHATDQFSLEGQLASYRHLQPDVVRRDIRFARQLQLSSKVKVPFPHSLSVVMRENPGGYLSLFTQGTADIILDCCDDFWDGKDLRPLSQQDRKRALDFYQRSALTAYCTAFSYRPLRHGIHGELGGSQHSNGPIAYLELPPESKIRMQHIDKSRCDFESHPKLSHSISTDSLLFSESKDDDINDVEGCFKMQCHQVFIGMVTMQYQAQTDIVQLVERLERACIRFVHFSKENELRSRVFSEKMGLESGWNCHISLLSDAENKSSGHIKATKSPKHSGNFDFTNTTSTAINITCPNNSLNCPSEANPKCLHAKIVTVAGDAGADDYDLNCLLPHTNLESTKTLSSSAPGAISNEDYNMLRRESSMRCVGLCDSSPRVSITASQDSLNLTNAAEQSSHTETKHRSHRHSQDSAMDENCRSLSDLTESTEQSAPVHFDMSNRAKLPRGIENIRPHLENVDNVPLQVSLFTDCSAEATREMLSIMQSYGEIVVCLGSSASNSNAEIFLQADCSIAVEPLYPQVCQDIPAYTEMNIVNNKLRLLRIKEGSGKGRNELNASIELLENGICKSVCAQSQANTISPIYLSRLLNSLPCSISVCREDPLSTVAIIELSRRFSSGLWNCIQFWACCAGSLSVLNIISACLSLPPLLMPLAAIYLMCIPVPLIALALAHIDVDPKIMNRATGKKQTEYDYRVFGFVVWCYGCKFITPILIMLLSYCIFMAHPLEIMAVKERSSEINLKMARIFALLGILVHFVIVSASFVHRDHSVWQRNPFRNRIWALTCFCILFAHSIICIGNVLLDHDVVQVVNDVWPAIVLTFCGCIISLVVSECCKWQEIKANARYQRRARLDFGTKLGMNSPF